MTTTANARAPRRLTTQRTHWGDRIFRSVCVAAAITVLAVLAAIVVTTGYGALPVLTTEGAGFVTGDRWVANDPDGDGPLTQRFGALSFGYGSVVVSTIALLCAVPISVGIALYLTQFAPRWLRTPAVTAIDLLAAVPSVVFGLWGVLVVAPAIAPAYGWIHDTFGDVPLLGGLFGEPAASGRSFATAGLIVGIMIIPIVTSISRAVLSTVPEADQHAALALGATHWEVIKGVVLPHSFGGIVGAVMLGLGRAIGETIAITLVIGGSVQITANLFASGYALPAVIVDQWFEATGLHRSALIGLGVVLFLITVVINVLARLIVTQTETRMRGTTA